MNISKNKRFQITNEKIENAFLMLLEKKDFDSIFVQQICQKAGITRTTFYSHYDDINDLIMEIERKKTQEIASLLITNKIPTPEIFKSYFQCLKENKKFYHVFFKTSDSSNIAIQKINEIFEQYPQITKYHHQTKRQLQYHMIFFQAGLKAISFQWLNDNCPESPEEMAKIIADEYQFLNRDIPANIN